MKDRVRQHRVVDRTKEFARTNLRHLGIEVGRFRPERTLAGSRARLIRTYQIDLILDVGANEGQYAREIREDGYDGRILSFEPGKEAFNRLRRNMMGDKRWTGIQCAVGAHSGQIELRLAANSWSSSVRDPLATLIDAAPEARIVELETAELKRLDCLTADFLEGSQRLMLKIDTQGYEMEVLTGAVAILPMVRIVQAELPVTALYEEESLLPELVTYLYESGFEIWNLEPGFLHPQTGRALEFEGLFVRSAIIHG